MEGDKFSKSLKMFLGFMFLNFVAINMGNVFINLFLMRMSSDANSALTYNLVSSVVILSAFFIIAPVSKKYNKKIGLVVGNIFSIFLYLAVIILGDGVGNYSWMLGLFSGVGQGFLWLSINVITVDLTNYGNRKKFSSINGIISSMAQMVAPLLAAGIVAMGEEVIQGYTYLFSFILIMMVVSLTLTLSIKVPKSNGSFSVSRALKVLDRKNLFSIGKVISKIFFREGVIGFVISLLIFEITKSEGDISKIITLTTIISITTYWVLPKIKMDMKRIYIVGTVLSVITVGILSTVFNSVVAIVMYSVLYGVANPLFFASSGVMAQNITEQIDEAGDYRLEITCIRETFIGIGRISGIIFLLVLYNISGDFSLIWVFGVLAVIISLSSIRDIMKITY